MHTNDRDDVQAVQADSLLVKDPKTGLRISTYDHLGNAGLWVSDQQGQSVGIVYQKDIGPYVTIFCVRDGQPPSLPLAITFSGIQLPEFGFGGTRRFIAWDDLYNHVQENKIPRPE